MVQCKTVNRRLPDNSEELCSSVLSTSKDPSPLDLQEQLFFQEENSE